MYRKQYFSLFIALLIFFIFVIFIDLKPGDAKITYMTAAALLMSILWITEAVPLAVTSLIPLFLFPILNLLDGEAVASSYINSTIFLFLGGFLLALAMERWNLHKRIALKIILFVGRTLDRIVFGFFAASAFISMWISNTATAMMMLPIGLAVIKQIEENAGEKSTHNFTLGVLLGIAYGSSIGGVGTLIGTPPNLSFIMKLKILFPNAPSVGFAQWMMFAVPLTLIMIFVACTVVTKILYKNKYKMEFEKNVIKEEYKKLGSMIFEEKVVMSVFTCAVLLWIFRVDFNFGAFIIPGWGNLLKKPEFINDGTIAIFAASLLFFIPAKTRKDEVNNILDGDIIRKVPWDIILLFGGGFALAKGFITSGLTEYIGSQFTSLIGIPTILLILISSIILIFLTSLTSNTATAEMMLPIMGAVSVSLGMHPFILMITTAISVSMDFMLPVGTPPNAIVFGSRRIKVYEMAKAGFIINVSSAFVITLIVYFLVPMVFGIEINTLPWWGRK
ncbi:MAG TPA: SLC13 family permease [Ignavibacteriaceae bacterium]|nr:SLC13 family permease [Ignavibacteriaceae bacterium]